MKALAPAALTAIEAGEAIVSGAVDIVPMVGGTTIRVWGGYGVLTIGGHDYQPLGDRAMAQKTDGAIGGTAQGYALSLSGVESAALALLDASEVKGASVTIYRLIFGVDGKTLLDARVFDRGRGDALSVEETVGGEATINLAVESAARALGRSLARLRADFDQRLIGASDGYYKFTAYAAEKALYWGGKKPSLAGSSVSPPSGNFGS